MMASQHTKVHDPMYNFDTHFPDRLSRLHLHSDLNTSGSFRKKKGRAQRNAARYKTQPVTFDEIKEVDEEPNQGSAASGQGKSTGRGMDAAAKTGGSAEHVLGQLQAFSRSMDGLLPRSSAAVFPAEHVPFHISHSRSGSRKFQRHPDCIPEKSENEPVSPEPSGTAPPVLKSKESPAKSDTSGVPAQSATAAQGGGAVAQMPASMAPRRQKITAKAKKRQKAQSESDAADT